MAVEQNTHLEAIKELRTEYERELALQHSDHQEYLSWAKREIDKLQSDLATVRKERDQFWDAAFTEKGKNTDLRFFLWFFVVCCITLATAWAIDSTSKPKEVFRTEPPPVNQRIDIVVEGFHDGQTYRSFDTGMKLHAKQWKEHGK